LSSPQLTSTPRKTALLVSQKQKCSARNSISAVQSTNSQRLEELVLNLRGRDWAKQSRKNRELLVDLCFQYWRARGFPHYSLTDQQIMQQYSHLESANSKRILIDDEIHSSMIGVKLANFFHPQMWRVKMKGLRSPYNCFADDYALRRLIRRSLTVWKDRCAVNANNLRGMLLTFSHTGRVSNFRSTAAKAIYEHYSREGDTVLDFSAGYGGRMLGCLPLNRTYIGIDPCREQINGLRRMHTRLDKLVRIRARTRIYQACAEDFLNQQRASSVSLVFSSPPYFNMERYSNNRSQSYIRFPTYEAWREGFMVPVVTQSRRILKKGGYFVINVANINGYKLFDDTLHVANQHFRRVHTLKLRLGHLPYLRKDRGSAYKHEPVLVFRKD
jgi:DNA methylase